MDTNSTPLASTSGPFVRLHRLPNWEERDRFEKFRASRGKSPYFQDPIFGQNLHVTENGFFLDAADLDDFEQVWLVGAGSLLCDGLRLPYHEVPGDRHQSETLQLIDHFFRGEGYTIWPSTHALLVVEHRLIYFLGAALYPSTAWEIGHAQAL